MEKNGSTFGGHTRLLVENRRTLLLHFCKCGIDIVYFQADMMQSFTALVQELRQAGIRGSWFDQLNLAAAGSAHGEKSDTHLLRWYVCYFTGCYAQSIAIKDQCL